MIAVSMDPFESYQLYNALKLHFESKSYDAFKYNFKTSATAKSFYKRKDKYFFAKLGNKYGKHLKEYYVSNFINGVTYVGDMLNESGDKNWSSYQKRHQAIHRVFSVDLSAIEEYINKGMKFDELFECDSMNVPFVIKLWMREEICLETIVILDSILGFIERSNSVIKETIIWPDAYRTITKFKPFVNFDRQKCLDLCKKKFT